MIENDMQTLLQSSHLSGTSAGYIDSLYEMYLKEPQSVSQEWQKYFSQLPKVDGVDKDVSHADIQAAFLKQARQGFATPATSASNTQEKKQAHVLQLINAFRQHGHHHAKLDPLGLVERHRLPDLELPHHQLSQSDLDSIFSTESPLTHNGSSLRSIYQALQDTYCDTIGVEYMHISSTEETRWIQQRLESVHSHPSLTSDQKREILKSLTQAEGLEKYLGSKYVGQKRFSLEGGDSLIPMLHRLTEGAVQHGVKEMVIGMAHRGRLNVLVNILGKDPKELFEEFEGKNVGKTSGDVKYHLGFSSNIKTSEDAIHLVLAFNPSHLEIIAPVVEGSVRARLYRRQDLAQKKTVVPVIIHGDAAFAGQGVVMETLNFSQARGYSTGGTVHIVINNQIGFTTSNPLDARSTLYCTDIAKMVQAPVFHVNADDPEAVVFVTQLALDFRMQFKKDVVVDLVCYRRHGHNEADEPAITQPLMYKKIRSLPTCRELYAKRLVSQNVVTEKEIETWVTQYRDTLDKGEAVVEKISKLPGDTKYSVDWNQYIDKKWTERANTAVPLKELQKVAKRIDDLPKDFKPHPVVKKMWEDRAKMTAGEMPLNWGYAETLAYGTLVDEGHRVRLSGQDCGRGTFAHRHAVLYDSENNNVYIPLEHISPEQKEFIVIDSILSEEAVLGFEYGYASTEPNALIIWEAQFGDFANGAQVVIDQFISSGEQKWGRLCGLVMLLPHGYEGQGPEHSSARLERYLQLCAQQNIQVCVPTTPAQIFHLLRRQIIRPFRKPLIVMTPKSLLRHKLAVSSLSDLATGEFQLIIPEVDKIDPKTVRKVVLCSGKVYYDLLQQRQEKKQTDVAIIRVEQLYPFPKDVLKAELAKYVKANTVVWCQEEPKNQGAWYSSQHNMNDCLSAWQKLVYAGRGLFAAPAVGYYLVHNQQQKALVDEALA